MADLFKGNLLLDSPCHSLFYIRYDHRIDHGAGENVQIPHFKSGFRHLCLSDPRNAGLLVQLFIIFYLFPAFQVTIDPFPSAIIAFSLNVGAYASEIIRASILSVPKGQWEAAYSIGMTQKTALTRVILPQAVRVSIPPLSNTFISLVKDTSLASQILVAELFRKAQEIGAGNLDQILIIYMEAAFIYWIICFVLALVQQRD